MKKRFHIGSGEPPTNGDEREWYVYDRARTCSRDCYDCPGTAVFVGTTRRAARQACAERNVENDCQIQPAHASLDTKANQP